MPATPNLASVTDATTRLINQFNQTVADQQQARVAAESCEAALTSHWGGQASLTYRQALGTWALNLDQVRQALLKLQEAMSQYSRNTDYAEDNNLQSVNVVSQQVAASASWT
ncbi:hypothetical protein OHA72_37055 [Dactylosporangium sp. NBC_01737]|uniref:hypothetical protein n=1 Tax=Dactylosporangium sp. NBC_01737 TaxID=2975959 RepID=UPI002E12559C|nr:hypothetical protein OHA72_37055 [Dactylosporangium sp. NBC_01737]